ncbi:MAG: cytochrome c [Myxococcales bacterium]|nr:cytochrome c [Myxococcales bacterium]
MSLQKKHVVRGLWVFGMMGTMMAGLWAFGGGRLAWARPHKKAHPAKKTGVSVAHVKRRWVALIDPKQGQRVFLKQGCNACHSVDGKRSIGPTMKGLYGSTITLQDGRKLLVTEKVLRTSILDPGRYLVLGFPPVMPTYRSHIQEPDTSALIAYLVTLGVKKPKKPVPSAPPALPGAAPSAPSQSPPLPKEVLRQRGRQLFLANACWSCHGMEADGKGPSAKELNIKPANLHAKHYKCGDRAKDVFFYLTNGSHNPESAMISYAYIPASDRWALAYYLLSLKK